MKYYATFSLTVIFSLFFLLLTCSVQAMDITTREAARREKLLAELKTEVAVTKYAREKAALDSKVTGSFDMQAKVSTYAGQEGKWEGRLKLALLRRINSLTTLRIGLDTMDSFFSGATLRSITQGMLDMEGKFVWKNAQAGFTFGPGKVVHTESNPAFAMDSNTVYLRPDSSLYYSTYIGKVEVYLAYVARQLATSGRIGVNELTTRLSLPTYPATFFIQPRYVFIQGGDYDWRCEAGLDYILNRHFQTEFLFGQALQRPGGEGAYYKIVQRIMDPFASGTDMLLRFDRVGANYRVANMDDREFVALNNFDRYVVDGAIDLGIKLKQTIGKEAWLEWLADYVPDNNWQYGQNYPGTYWLWGAVYGCRINEASDLKLFYKHYEVPSGVAQFSENVPNASGMWGIGLAGHF